MVYKRVCRNCPIPSCGAKYLVRLANHLADVHQLDHIQRDSWLKYLLNLLKVDETSAFLLYKDVQRREDESENEILKFGCFDYMD